MVGLFRVLAPGIVMRQHLVKLFQPVWIQLLYGLSYPFMNLLPPLEKKAIVGYLLSKGVFEDIFQLRKQALLIDELQPLEVEEIRFKLLSHSGDGL